jgi:hypothetical protein
MVRILTAVEFVGEFQVSFGSDRVEERDRVGCHEGSQFERFIEEGPKPASRSGARSG